MSGIRDVAVVSFALLLGAQPLMADGKPAAKVIIAHRGASGYLPEHTLEGVAMAHAWGVDYIEPDVVLSRDGEPLVLHDIHLDTTTDVATRFPGRSRDDGRWYAVDFDLKEVKTLAVSERRHAGSDLAVFPQRFPLAKSRFEVPTLSEFIELIKGLNQTTGRGVGIYPEIKSPAFHREAGLDISRIVMATLRRYGYNEPGSKVFLQCFDSQEVKRLRGELAVRLPLVQLIGDDAWGETKDDYGQMRTAQGLREVAAVADGVGLWIGHALEQRDGQAVDTGLVARARAAGLTVHLYTARADKLPAGVSFEALLEKLLFDLGADGVFSDHGDRALSFLRRRLAGRD